LHRPDVVVLHGSILVVLAIELIDHADWWHHAGHPA